MESEMSKDEILKRHGATEEPFWRRPLPPIPTRSTASHEETWPPATVAMTVDEEPPAADEGDCQTMSASQAPSSIVPPIPPQEVLRQAELAVDTTRHELRLARDTLASARTNVAKALADYNRAAPKMTAEQNTRDWIAANNAARAERAASRFIPTVTETARAMGGGGHGIKRGGGSAYRRGPGGVQAFTKTEAMTLEANRLRLEAAKRGQS
jgi:hypothetical protein